MIKVKVISFPTLRVRKSPSRYSKQAWFYPWRILANLTFLKESPARNKPYNHTIKDLSLVFTLEVIQTIHLKRIIGKIFFQKEEKQSYNPHQSRTWAWWSTHTLPPPKAWRPSRPPCLPKSNSLLRWEPLPIQHAHLVVDRIAVSLFVNRKKAMLSM